MLIRSVLLGIGLFLSGSIIAAPRDIDCPAKLTPAMLDQLSNDGHIAIDHASFHLDGGSKKEALHSISHKQRRPAPLAYSRKESGRIVCWYQTDSGFVGLRQR